MLSGELGSASCNVFQLRIPKLDPLIKFDIFLALVSVDLEYHDEWCALMSPMIRVSGVVRRGCIED